MAGHGKTNCELVIEEEERSYYEFIKRKTAAAVAVGGFEYEPSGWLYDFQRHLVEWAVRSGRAAIFADCGLGKTPMQLDWSNAIVQRENKPVLILTPLSVTQQTVAEADKFGVEASRSRDGKLSSDVVVTNYEKLHLFNPHDFSGVVCDESSILKNYSGKIRNAVIEFLKPIRYRLLCSATPSPNDYTELGNSCEALGQMRRVEMLASYFVHDGGNTSSWRLKGHAKNPFWQFVASWARAVRKPSDLGFDDELFVLPDLNMSNHVLASAPLRGSLFAVEAITLQEQRQERRETIDARCEKVAEIANSDDSPFVAWCSLNDESKKLASLIDDCVEITGSQSDDEKEERMVAFQSGEVKRIVTKPSMAAFGLNWQHCHRMSFFPSHSHEQFYQAVRRCLRFGQTKPVSVHIVTTEAESAVLDNLMRKERDASAMFEHVVAAMKTHYDKIKSNYSPTNQMETPSWLTSSVST